MGLMAKYGEPWAWEGEHVEEPRRDQCEYQNIMLRDATQAFPLECCACCDGLSADKRIIDRIVLCVNVCEGFTDDELREVAKAGVVILKTEE